MCHPSPTFRDRVLHRLLPWWWWLRAERPTTAEAVRAAAERERRLRDHLAASEARAAEAERRVRLLAQRAAVLQRQEPGRRAAG